MVKIFRYMLGKREHLWNNKIDGVDIECIWKSLVIASKTPPLNPRVQVGWMQAYASCPLPVPPDLLVRMGEVLAALVAIAHFWHHRLSLPRSCNRSTVVAKVLDGSGDETSNATK